MPLFRVLVLCAIAALSSAAARADKEIIAEPATITTGQTTTLHWYFTGDKVTISGGRFGSGVVVTGRQKLIDTPAKTTRYTYDVYFHALATMPAGAQGARPLHARYTVVVEVVPMPPTSLYRASCGWQVNYLRGWLKSAVATADQPNDGLVYFQQEEDALERLAVATMPAKTLTASDLMQRIESDLPSHYDEVTVLSREEITFRKNPAILSTFTAIDQAHPGTRTQSIVLAFVRSGSAYIVSARTGAAHYKARMPILDRLIRSFVVAEKSAGSESFLRTASSQTK